MKKSLLQLFLCMATMLVVNVAQSQDYLYLINSDTIKSKVLEVNENDVKYKDFENPDGPVYTINKSRIDKIIYQNGKVDYFNSVATDNNQNSIQNLPESNNNQSLPKLLSFDQLMAFTDAEKEAYLSTIGIQSIYEKFKKGQSFTEKGKRLRGTGVFITIGGCVLYGTSLVIIEDRFEEGAILYVAGSVALTAGQLLIIASIPFSAVGGGLKKYAESQYQDFTLGKSYTSIQPVLNFWLTQNGVGLSLKF